MSSKMIATILAFVLLLECAVALGAGGDNTQVKGMIISRTGDALIVKSANQKITVLLTDDTVTKDDKGLFGLQKEEMANTVLIPGLKVKIDGTTDMQNRFVAKTITVDGDDLEAAQMIQSGLHPTAEQVQANVQHLEAHQQGIEQNQQNIAANKQQIDQNIKDIEQHTNRFAALSDYKVKATGTLYFPVGSSQLSAKNQQTLHKMAQVATGLNGYIIEVMGYTDSSGNPVMNDKLSEERAKSVVKYLTRQGNIPVRHIVAPGAMGEYGPAESNESKTGRAQNRRVVVKVLVNKGITGA